ncbi:MAG: hypothetical protein Q9170_004380, partial [Blastenia crenularia]
MKKAALNVRSLHKTSELPKLSHLLNHQWRDLILVSPRGCVAVQGQNLQITTPKKVEGERTRIETQAGNTITKGAIGGLRDLHTANAIDQKIVPMSASAESTTPRAADPPKDAAVTLAVTAPCPRNRAQTSTVQDNVIVAPTLHLQDETTPDMTPHTTPAAD